MATIQSGEGAEGDRVLAEGREGAEGRVVVACCSRCGGDLPIVDAVVRCGCGALLATEGGLVTVTLEVSDDGALEIGASISGPRGRR